MIVVNGFIAVGRDDVNRLMPVLIRQVQAARAQDGCALYAIGVDLFEPNILRVGEVWRDRTAQAAHLIGDHMAHFNVGMKLAQIVSARIEASDGQNVAKMFQMPRPFFLAQHEGPDAFFRVHSRSAPQAGIGLLRMQVQAARAAFGNRGYDVARDVFDASFIIVLERWDDADAMHAYEQRASAGREERYSSDAAWIETIS